MGVIATMLAVLSLVITYLVLPESPRYLEGKRKFEEANKVLAKIQKYNGNTSKFFLTDKTYDTTATATHSEIETAETLKGSYLELFSIPVYRKNVFIMMIIWSFGSFAFFMVPYYLKNVKADIYNLSIATEVAEFLASVACLYIQERMELKKALFFFCSLIALGSFGMLFIAEDVTSGNASKWNVGLVLLTNLGIVSAFDIAYLINA